MPSKANSKCGSRCCSITHVGPLRPGTVPGLTVSPERFEHQVRWLARWGYTGILPSDWVR